MLSIFKKRVIAYLADFFVVSAIFWIVSTIAGYIIIPYALFIVYNYFIFIVPIFTLIYFIIGEKVYQTTVGKHLMFLKVESTDGTKISYKQAIIRNISKIYWIPIILDLLLGDFKGSSKERYLGKKSNTTVVDE